MGNFCLIFSVSRNIIVFAHISDLHPSGNTYFQHILTLPGLDCHGTLKTWEQSCFFLHWWGHSGEPSADEAHAKLALWEYLLVAPAVVRKASQILPTRQGGVKAAAAQNVKASQILKKWFSSQNGKLSSCFKQGVLFWLGEGTAALKQITKEDT